MSSAINAAKVVSPSPTHVPGATAALNVAGSQSSAISTCNVLLSAKALPTPMVPSARLARPALSNASTRDFEDTLILLSVVLLTPRTSTQAQALRITAPAALPSGCETAVSGQRGALCLTSPTTCW